MRLSTRTRVFVVIACVSLAGSMYLLVKWPSRDSANHSPLSSKAETAQGRKEPAQDVSDVSDSDRDFEEFRQTVGGQMTIELMEKAVYELKQHDPREFVHRSDHEITPALTRELLKPDSLPTLYALLEDPAYREYWSRVARTICFLGDDSRSVPVIIKYIRRSDGWKQGAIETHYECVEKIETLKWLGFLGGEEAERFLMKAMTPDGVREIAEAWINGPLPVWATTPEEEIVGIIQGLAAIGIVHSQSQEGIRQAEALYAAARADRQQREHIPPQLHRSAEAMVIRDLIQSIGMEAYLERLGTPGHYKFTILPRTLEYAKKGRATPPLLCPTPSSP